jgi:hypothetical protein
MVSTTRIDPEPGHEQHQNIVESTDSRSTNKLPKDETIEHLPTFAKKQNPHHSLFI